MIPMPRETALDSTVALFNDPYRFISRRCHHHGSNAFQARILGMPTICLSGPQAARLFYDGDRFQRATAAPEPLRATLFGKKSVQTLDDSAHHQRKSFFKNAFTPEAIASLGSCIENHWYQTARRWPADDIPLYQASQDVLARAACDWAGVPLHERDAQRRTPQFVALFDDAARGIFLHLQSRLSRKSLEAWLASVINDVREGRSEAAPHSIVRQAAWHLGADGKPLDPSIAAVELLNVLRPIVAISVFIVFGAHALQHYPEARQRFIEDSDPHIVSAFLNEVRRFYPFFPAVIARVRRDFEWNGYQFPQGWRTMLDLYGTNHDRDVWDKPEQFDPDRFQRGEPTPFTLIPQGGGNVAKGHRCPGEAITLTAMAVTLRFLTQNATVTSHSTRAGIDMKRLPALPKSRLLMRAHPGSLVRPL